MTDQLIVYLSDIPSEEEINEFSNHGCYFRGNLYIVPFTTIINTRYYEWMKYILERADVEKIKAPDNIYQYLINWDHNECNSENEFIRRSWSEMFMIK